MVKPDPRVILKEHNIPITIQRVKILEYLIRTNEHPTADQIYSEISDEAI
ncbi:MAG TPA: transcriptional repressor, partial [Firmicutes bacterium]|nr:transcriptional repressor [Bacillota bacterium]